VANDTSVNRVYLNSELGESAVEATIMSTYPRWQMQEVSKISETKVSQS
ncbi:unnamed protein product, partial [marine sediment metagenome]